MHAHDAALDALREELRRSEERLARAGRRFEDLYELAPAAYLTLDEAGVIVEANRLAASLLAVPNGTLIGQSILRFVVDADHENYLSHAPGGVDLCTRHVCEVRLVRRGDDEFWARLEANLVGNVSDHAPGARRFQVMVSDITDRKRAEEAHREGEARETGLRTMLAQSDRLASVGMLAAGVAHEINNPLCYVLSNVDVLTHELPKIGEAVHACCAALRSELGDEAFTRIVGDRGRLIGESSFADVTQYAREALEGTERIRTIARALGTFSRVEAEARGPVNLKRCIEGAIRMAFNEIKYRAKLVTRFDDVPPIWGSEGKLGQLFLNLLVNASHAIHEGNIDDNQIAVRTWAEGECVFAEIEDTGKGIASCDLARVFDPFFTTKPVGVGTGLGLAICRNVVVELGGELRVRSEVGRGSRFTVSLPVRPIEPETRPIARHSSFPPPSVTPPHGRVLVVDDETVIRHTIARSLGAAHDVVTVSSGEEAKTLLARDARFDVIICDLMMPTMTGMELHAWLITAAPKLAKRMLFVTGGAFTPQGTAFLASVKNVRLEKPFRDVALVEAVRALVARSHGLPAPPAAARQD